MSDNQEVWKSEYELRQFIFKATRYKVETIKKQISDKYPYSPFFENDISISRDNYELFRNQLRDKLSNSPNWKAIKVDTIDRFIPMIENYKEWHELNYKEINTIHDHNPYEIMLDIIEKTEKVIYSYFGKVDDFERYNITGQTPFSFPSVNLFPLNKLTRDYFEEFKLRYDIKLKRFNDVINKIEDINKRNAIINDTYDKFIKLSEKTNITNYKEYFYKLADNIKALQVRQTKDNTLPPQQTEKPKPELNEALISFSSPEAIINLHNELKGYFQGSEAELLKALKGEHLNNLLLFPHNQNKFVEVFKRLKYNGFLLSTPKETKEWICSTFTYQYKKGNKKEVREFNTSTVHDILTKDKGEPTKRERICIVDWLPYKSHLTRQREAEKENI